jgi:nitroreductase
MKKPAISSSTLHPVIAERWSPRAFDENFTISDTDVTGLIEAARWAPSSGNNQPWRYLVTKRSESKFDQITETLMGFNQAWAPRASLYIVACIDTVSKSGEPNTTALYDLGLSASLLTVEAVHRGFAVHQIEGFDHVALKSLFISDPNIEPVAILVIGKQAEAEILASEVLVQREKAPRVRKEINEILI